MKTAGASRWFVAAGALILAAGPVLAAPTPQEVLAKVRARMDNAKTYQATYKITSPMGVGTMVLKTIPKKKQSLTIDPPGIQIVDDGKTMFMYNKAMNSYAKTPSRVAQSGQIVQSMMAALQKTTLKFGPPTSIKGVPALVIEAAQNKGTGRSTIYVAQSDYRILKVVDTGTRPGAPGQPGQPVSQTLEVVSEKVNAPIPDSAFRFTPPPGAKEMRGRGPGPTGGPGGPAPRK